MMFPFGRRARAGAESVEPLWVDLTEPDILGRFLEAVACWASRLSWSADDTVMLACNLLVEGFDTPSLRDLASYPRDAGWVESRDVLMATCAELGLQFPDQDSREAQLLALRFLCRLFLTGALIEREFARSAHNLFGYDPPPVAKDLAELEYVFEGAEEGWGRKVVDGLADKYARAFLATVSTSSTTG